MPYVIERKAFLPAWIVLVFLLACALSQGSSKSWAQIGGFTAPTEAMNTLSSGSVGPSGGAGMVERTRATVGAPMPAGVGAGMSPEAAATAAGLMGGGAAETVPTDVASTAAVLEQYKPKESVKALEGDRIMDAVLSKTDPRGLLDDPQGREYDKAYFESTKNSDKKTFSDDGESLGDLVKDDRIFSRINRTKSNPNGEEYTGGVSHSYLRKMISILGYVRATPSTDYNRYEMIGPHFKFYPNPTDVQLHTAIYWVPSVEFFGLTATTTEPFSSIEQERKWNNERNNEVLQVDASGMLKDSMSKKFLDPYRQEKGKAESDFYKLYVPVPPAPPATLPATGWVSPHQLLVPGGVPASASTGATTSAPTTGATVTVTPATDATGVSTIRATGNTGPLRDAVGNLIGADTTK
ncbi:TPA: hypothetical protein DDW35_04840 [Candidatus Sumerlaeota bacterium]|jgi:hypothetical protein|nr:hypothetical protein [Candidatus Sumerlaeota bacterium]